MTAAPIALDPAALTADLIRCASVTPADDGAIDTVARALAAAGFRVSRCDRGGIANLYARYGDSGPVLGFNGHTDVVPVGDPAAWSHPPFSGALVDGVIWGRGAVDMKSGVAAWVAAACAWASRRPATGSLALLITGDEEGASTDGTLAILDWMAANGERLDACIVGEPTSVDTLGDVIKIGRRGALTAHFTATGVQGHSAYPHKAANPLPALMRLLDRLASTPLDDGTAHFDPSTLQITTVDVGNPAHNVIPAAARATVNIRFNDRHDEAALIARLRAEADAAEAADNGGRDGAVRIAMQTRLSGDAFLTPPGPFVDMVAGAVARASNQAPALTTGGGTSDARFVKAHCPVVEVGLVGRGMHAVDERVPADEVRRLADVYGAIIDGFMAA